MSTTAVRSSQQYEDAYRAYYAEAAEESRAVRVGEKETSEQAAIVARHADLFTAEQLEALRADEAGAADADQRERLYRLRRSCEGGIVDAELAEREDELGNAILAARLTFDGRRAAVAVGRSEARGPAGLRRPGGARRAGADARHELQRQAARAARRARGPRRGALG